LATAEPARREVVKLTLPNAVAYLPMARSFVREAAVCFGFEGSPLSEIEVAVEEAVTNVMSHGYDAEESVDFRISCQRLPQGIAIIIHEMGMPFDPARIPQYAGPNLDEGSAAGLGVHLMRSLMDECSFVNLGPEGKQTRLVKYLPGASPSTAAELPAAPPEPQIIQEKVKYAVRQMRDEEAIEISRCAYKSHGYSFFDDHIYYPERLVELNRSGEMISAVAVTEAGAFMGHAALLFQYPEDIIAELTFVFVNLEYRGQGALGRLNEFLLHAPTKRPLVGYYAYGVANHPMTQKTMVRSGIADCGILLATSPVSWKFKGIPGDATQRISVVLGFKYMETPPRLTLYPPPHHKEMVARLYHHLGTEHDYATPSVEAPPEVASDIKTGINESEGCAEIFVARGGRDLVREVRRLLRGFCLKQVAAINLFLNMQDPATYWFTEELEKLGFFFAGILPRARVGDTLILQYLNNVDLDYGKIVAYSEMAQKILAYIRAHDPNESI